MRKNLVFTPLMVLLAAGGSVNSLSAQDMTSAVMAGRVTSQGGQPLRGVRVIVNSPALLGPRETTTDASGNFRLPILPSGTATVTYVLDGYITRRLTIPLMAGQVSNANASMTPINMQEETVEVIGRALQLDKTDTVVQNSFTNEKMNELLKAGDLTMAQVLVPGVAGANLQGNPNIRGGSNRSTKILYNGVPTSDLFGGYVWSEDLNNLFLQDMVESFAVLLSPSNARYGNTDGGVVSMVSRRGGNEFKGVLRVADMRRPFWNQSNTVYPRRDGTWTGINRQGTAPNDQLTKRFEFTLEGPLWKDRLSFAYGGVLRPPSYSEWRPGRDRWGTGNTLSPTTSVGTWYQNNQGDIIRRSELRAGTDPETIIYSNTKSDHNQFNLYGQITPNHQVEYLYKESTVSQDDGRWGNLWDVLDPEVADGRNPNRQDRLYETQRDWSIAYKGIIGASGVLDFRYGKHDYSTWLGNAAGTRMYIYQMSTYIPEVDRYRDAIGYTNYGQDSVNDPSRNYANFANYNANGWMHVGLSNQTGYSGYPYVGVNNDTLDGGVTTTMMLNYQHHLEAFGSHLIDVGYQSDKLDWTTKRYGLSQYTFEIPGQLPKNLTERDIYRNPNDPTPISNTPGGRLSAAQMAGKYIVWNMRTATTQSIDPWGHQWGLDNISQYAALVAANGGNPLPLWPNPSGLPRWATNQFYPRLTERYGADSGKFFTQMNSFYINDMWTLNDHHSVMLGVRFDMFKVWDETKDIASYTKPTFRFSYKWDIKGDNSQLVAVTFNQYHNMLSGNTFVPFGASKQTNLRVSMWDREGPNGTGVPYLVGIEDILDRNNYGWTRSDDVFWTPEQGTIGARIDPDWRGMHTNEFAISFARNFSRGGTFKITYVQRGWADLYDIFPGEIVRMPTGINQMTRVMKNTDEFGRSYKGVEVEWNIPITKRLEFGGNYTHGRLMHNQSNISTTAVEMRDAYSSAAYQMPEWWDSLWPREVWRPTLLQNSEHFWNWWFIYDLSSGKTQSSLALRGRYDTNGYGYRTQGEVWGYPIIDGVYDFNGNTNISGLSTGVSKIYGKSKSDGDWNTTLRYNLTLPLYRKFSWFLTATMSDPFNHRKRNGSGIVGFSMPTNRVLRNYTEPNGTIRVQNLEPYNGLMYPENPDFWGAYMGRGGGRSVTIDTGIRF